MRCFLPDCDLFAVHSLSCVHSKAPLIFLLLLNIRLVFMGSCEDYAFLNRQHCNMQREKNVSVQVVLT